MRISNGHSYHDFTDSYKLAEDGKCEPFWNEVYKKAFPNLINHMRGADYACNSQSAGVDRIILLDNLKTITIDEKIRSKFYPDIALEFISNDQKGTPGWMEKDLAIDYLAYAFLDRKEAYLFNWHMLKFAWLFWRNDWKENYYIAKAANKTYNTLSVCVPIDTLMNAVQRASVIKL